MKLLRGRRGWMIGMFIGYLVLAIALGVAHSAGASQTAAGSGAIGVAAFNEPTYSSPIALSADKNQLWVVNPDDDSVSVIDVSSADPASYQLIRTIRVGNEPQSIA